MCLIVFALEYHPKYRLVLAANRDEYFDRPTIPAGYWPDNPSILAGRDLQSGGTWLGVTTTGRLAAVTNYRDTKWHVENPPSRGLLVAEYLSGNMSPPEYLENLKTRGHRYDGFNLLFGDSSGIFYYSNRGEAENVVSPGIHGLSNHLLDTPWPKVTSAKKRFEALLNKDTEEPEEFFAVLADGAPFPDDTLPETGVGIKRERFLSSIFMTSRTYGTCFTTLLFIDRENGLRFVERSHDPQRSSSATAEFSFVMHQS
ncbi:NRDE family protein [Geobacter sp. SVR]|uniref:NRDE family protein n=1 Tax=Geobacter sp. SVR TaxID=2495594 RepID=UPI00156416FA|nr:NRDE family protein [Geobacter sp. SVR]